MAQIPPLTIPVTVTYKLNREAELAAVIDWALSRFEDAPDPRLRRAYVRILNALVAALTRA